VSEDVQAQVLASAARAREAAIVLAPAARAAKDAALYEMADALDAAVADVLLANARDVSAGREAGMTESLIDRLRLDEARVAAMSAGLRDVAALPDPVGEVVRGYTQPNGLQIRQVRVPFGVIAMIYEARPNVTVDATALAIKSGNVALLRGSASAMASNTVLVEVLANGAEKAGLPRDVVQLVPGADHSSVTHLLRARGLIDLVIPRGGAGLINYVVENSSVPVIETGIGVVHVYVDAESDQEMARRIIINAKVSRPSVCNSAETILVHKDIAAEFIPKIMADLQENEVVVHGDRAFVEHDQDVIEAIEEDWHTEYLGLEIAARVVDDVDDAIAHIRRYSSGHTEAIVTTNFNTAQRFVSLVDSAAVMVNASTRFTDGAEFGFGAEIGISTQKTHARGPMGLTELTSTKWIVFGDGQIR